MASSIAHVDPLPFVPVTVMTGQTGAMGRRDATSRTRARPSAIDFGCSVSRYASQPASVVGRVIASGMLLRLPASSGRRRLPRQHRQKTRELVAQLPAVDDHVDGAFLEQKLGALKAIRQFLAHRLLDDAGPREPDQRAGL